jgi:hypothetical protein
VLLDASGNKKAGDRGHGHRPFRVPLRRTELDASTRTARVVGADGVDVTRRIFLNTVHRRIMRTRRCIGNPPWSLRTTPAGSGPIACTGNDQLACIFGIEQSRPASPDRSRRREVPSRRCDGPACPPESRRAMAVGLFGSVAGMVACTRGCPSSRRQQPLPWSACPCRPLPVSALGPGVVSRESTHVNLPWIDPSNATTLVSVNGSTNVTSHRSAVNG